MANSPLPIQPDLTRIALSYKQNNLIADSILPRVPVSKQDFKYFKYTKEDPFTIPDTKVGRKGMVNQVEFGGTEVTDSVYDYALSDVVSVNDVVNSMGTVYDPKKIATEGIARLLDLDREVRVSNAVFNAANYNANNKVTLSGTSQFSDFANSDPVGVILAALDSCIMRPNSVTIGRPAWSILMRHPKIVQAVYKTAQNSGIVSQRMFADLFELQNIFVGEAFLNTARKGQAASFARVWGKHISFIYQDASAATSGSTTFGFTAQWQGKQAYDDFDRTIGARGSSVVKVVDSVKEVVCADDLGYFIQNAVA